MPDAPVLLAGRYRLGESLGRGGMGEVLLARDETLERDVAIKELYQPFGGDNAASARRTLREARAAARISHPNVVQVYDVLQLDDRTWIVMEYVPCRSLRDEVAAQGPLDPYRVAQIGLDLLGALSTAHRLGVEHRDVKPANVLLADDGRVLLTDFGIAAVDDDGVISRSDVLVGSPQFMAPERARTGASGPAADLWSLGATLYAAVEGRAPYERGSTMATLTALTTEEPDPPKQAGAVRPLLDGLLRKDPAVRITAEDAEVLARGILTGVSGEEEDAPGGRPAPTGLAGFVASLPAAFRIPRPRAAGDRKPPARADDPAAAGSGVAGSGVAGSGVAGSGVAGSAVTGAGPGTGSPEADSPEAAFPGGAEHSDGVPGDSPVAASPAAAGEAPAAAGKDPGGNAPPDVSAAGAGGAGPVDGDGPGGNGRGPGESDEVVAEADAAGGSPAAAGAGAVVSSDTRIDEPVTEMSGQPFARGRGVVPGQQRQDVPDDDPVAGVSGNDRSRRRLIVVAAALAVVVATGTVWAVNAGEDNSPEAQPTPTPVSTQATSAVPQGAPSAGPSTDPAQAPPVSASPSAPQSAGPSASPSPSAGGRPPLPAGWVEYTDKTGFSVYVPAGWKRSQKKGSTMVYFRGDGKSLGIDQTNQPKSDPVADWTNQRNVRKARNEWQDYREVKIDAVPYFRKAADWEWTFIRDGERRHANNRGTVISDKKAYGFYWETSDAEWKDSLGQIQTVYDSFQPAK